MKNVILSMVAFLAFTTFAIAQTNHVADKAKSNKVIVMVNTASWCPTCKANGSRVEKEVVSTYMSNPKFQVVVNDLSNDETKAKSKQMCESAGIMKVAQNNNGTGVIYFINSETKEVVSQIGVSKSSEEIKKAFESAATKI